MVIFQTAFGLIWTTPWPGEKNLFLKFANCEICKIRYENLNISPRQAKPKNFFDLHSD